jgi:hypothetical protein
VEKLNSAQDSRELYFKNKVSGLMVRPTVVKAMTATSRKQSEGAEAKQQQGATRNGNDRSHEGTVSTSFYVTSISNTEQPAKQENGDGDAYDLLNQRHRRQRQTIRHASPTHVQSQQHPIKNQRHNRPKQIQSRVAHKTA